MKNVLLLVGLFSVSLSTMADDVLPEAIKARLLQRPNIVSWQYTHGELHLVSAQDTLTLDEMVAVVNALCGSMRDVQRKWNAAQQRIVVSHASYVWQPALIKSVSYRATNTEGFVFVGGGKSCDRATRKKMGTEADSYLRSRIHKAKPMVDTPPKVDIARSP
ncbi:hypothetical protein CIG19_12980 [Enterobacterales bacterium CwR94]|nr:hypothetical protein CIG19_12980 [Enterobacterales bacterium CwR94]